MNGKKPREIAAQILRRRTQGGGFLEDVLEKELAPLALSTADRGLCRELVFGVERWRATLDWLINRKTEGRTQKPALQDLLRLGLYQIFWLDRIPNHAAVHETVEQAKRGGFGPQAGFINAVLRGYLREFEATKSALAELKQMQPAIGYSHPEWLVTRWQQRWGSDKAAKLMEWNNTPPKIFARLNALKTDAGKLLTQWRDENVEYDFIHRDWIEENLIFELKSHPPLAGLQSFKDGWFYVQDPSTLLAVRELDPRPGETVLDLCSAPGGKLTYAAQLMQNQGRLVAHDISSERLKLVRENCERLGVISAVIEPRELSCSPHKFDKILVDAPCSNTGVMRRRVDLRWRIKPEELERLAKVQLDLLNQAAAVLKPRGTLVYSTCSLEPEENSAVVKKFLAGHAGFKLAGEQELIPFNDNVDGAYLARMKASAK